MSEWKAVGARLDREAVVAVGHLRSVGVLAVPLEGDGAGWLLAQLLGLHGLAGAVLDGDDDGSG